MRYTVILYDGIRKLWAPFGIAEKIKYIIGIEEIQQQHQHQQQQQQNLYYNSDRHEF